MKHSRHHFWRDDISGEARHVSSRSAKTKSVMILAQTDIHNRAENFFFAMQPYPIGCI